MPTVKRIITRNEKAPGSSWVDVWLETAELEKLDGNWVQLDGEEDKKIESFELPRFREIFGYAPEEGERKFMLIA